MRGIPCPDCKNVKNRVLYTRPQRSYITRRRECNLCSTRFTTIERKVKDSLKK